MFVNFQLKKTQVWVPMALLLLSFSVCPHSSYPHAPEDEDPTEEEGNPEDHEENQQLAPNEDNDLEEEETEEEAAEDVENDKKKPCLPRTAPCTYSAECCQNTFPGWTVECRVVPLAKPHEPMECLNAPPNFKQTEKS